MILVAAILIPVAAILMIPAVDVRIPVAAILIPAVDLQILFVRFRNAGRAYMTDDALTRRQPVIFPSLLLTAQVVKLVALRTMYPALLQGTLENAW